MRMPCHNMRNPYFLVLAMSWALLAFDIACSRILHSSSHRGTLGTRVGNQHRTHAAKTVGADETLTNVAHKPTFTHFGIHGTRVFYQHSTHASNDTSNDTHTHTHVAYKPTCIHLGTHGTHVVYQHCAHATDDTHTHTHVAREPTFTHPAHDHTPSHAAFSRRAAKAQPLHVGTTANAHTHNTHTLKVAIHAHPPWRRSSNPPRDPCHEHVALAHLACASIVVALLHAQCRAAAGDTTTAGGA